MRHIPNILCVLRILMVGVFVAFFVHEQYIASMLVYCLAFFTDILDGYLARRNNWITDLGKLLDPLADKLMLLTALTCFCFKGWLPLPILLVVAAKELAMIFGGIFVLKKKNFVVFSDWSGKIAAGCFNFAVVLTLLKNFFPIIDDLNLDLIVYSIAIVLALVALFHYANMRVFHDPNASAQKALEKKEQRKSKKDAD